MLKSQVNVFVWAQQVIEMPHALNAQTLMDSIYSE